MKYTHSILAAITSLFLVISCGPSDKTQTTSSGFNYAIVHDASGSKANPGDFVYFELDIKDDKGKILQSVRDQPRMPVEQVPAEGETPQGQNVQIALKEALGAVSVGDTVSIIIPTDSLPPSPAMKDMVYIEYLIDIKEILSEEDYNARLAKENEEAQAKMAGAKARESEVASMIASTLESYKKGTLKDIQKTPEGLEYVIHEKGSGPKLEHGKTLTAQYYGVLKSDGSMFDNSFSRGQGYPFALGTGAVIQGWHVGFANLSKGDKATLFIPYALAYGEAGRPGIPAKSDLVFYVEVE